jgi:hypothetical protein
VAHRGTFPSFRMSRGIFAILIVIGASLSLARGQDPVAGLPKNYSLAFENDIVAVIRVHYGPHEKIGVHDHSRFPTVYVYLSDSGPVRFEHLEEHSFGLTRPPTEKGAFRVSPGRVERHSVENLGNESSDFLRVELKQILLGGLRPFRGKAPPSPLQSQTSVEFTAPGLEIQRVICASSSGCPLRPSSAPSLIVAFTSVELATGISGTQREKLEAGAVRWLPASEKASITVDSLSSAHILRILVPATS